MTYWNFNFNQTIKKICAQNLSIYLLNLKANTQLLSTYFCSYFARVSNKLSPEHSLYIVGLINKECDSNCENKSTC